MAMRPERWTALNGAEGSKAWHGDGSREEEDSHTAGMIRTHYTRQTVITNSTPPVGDNYRDGRGYSSLVEHEGLLAKNRSARGSESS